MKTLKKSNSENLLAQDKISFYEYEVNLENGIVVGWKYLE